MLTRNLSQKSPKRGLSIAFKLSFVAASTLTYNCMHERIKRFVNHDHGFNFYFQQTDAMGINRPE